MTAPNARAELLALALPAESLHHLRAFLDYIQVECGLSVNTRKAYQTDLRHFLSEISEQGAGELSGLSPRHIEAFVRSAREGGLSASSVSRRLAAVRMFCRYLVLERVAKLDVSAGIESPKTWHRLPSVLSDQTVRGLLEAPQAETDPHAARDRAMLTLLYATGIRASELAGLTLGDVSANLGVIRVLGKGSKERIVPVAADALDLVESYVDGVRREVVRDPSVGAVFLSRNGRALSRQDVYRIVRKYVARVAPGRGVSPHTLRHCFATQLLSHGADLRSVQEMLGHADITTTQIYTHVDASRLKAVHKRFHPRG